MEKTIFNDRYQYKNKPKWVSIKFNFNWKKKRFFGTSADKRKPKHQNFEQ